MAGFLHDRVFDNGLSTLSNEANQLVICSVQPTSYAEAFTNYKLGTKTSPDVADPSDRTGGGRKVTTATFVDGTVSGNGTANAYALIDTLTSRLLATNVLANPQVVTSGNSFSLAAFDIGIPDPVT